MREFVVLVTNRYGWRVYLKAFGRRWAFGPGVRPGVEDRDE